MHRSQYTLGLLFLGAYGLACAAVLGVERFAESDFVKTGFPRIALKFGGYDANHYAGILVSTLTLPLAVQLFYTASWKSNLAFGTAASWVHVFITATCLWFALRMYWDWRASNLIECGVVMCAFWGDTARTRDTANGYHQMLSVPLFAMAIGFAAVHLWFAVSKWLLLFRARRPTADDDQEPLISVPPLPPPASLNQTRRRRLWCDWTVTLTVLLIGAFTSILLPNSWLNWTARKIRINAIEIVDAKSAFRDFKFGLVTRPEVPGAVFRTVEVHFGSSNRVVGKLYPDVYLFYGWLLACLLVLSCVSRWRSRLRLGLCLALSLVGLASYIHAWWFHNWHGWFGGVGEFIFKEPELEEKLARTSGQVALLLLGIVLLPVSRTSSLLRVTQVPHEPALAAHRFMANAFLLAVVVHVACWYWVFANQEVFPHDALTGVPFVGSTPAYFPLNYHAKPGHCRSGHRRRIIALSCLDPEYNKPAADNFTLPLMNFVLWLVMLPAFGVLTWRWVRRQWFEWFYYAHTFAGMVLVLAVAWHAACVLVFLLPALLFITIDVCTRFAQASNAQWRVAEIVQGDGLTSLRISNGGGGIWEVAPGQYVLLQVPAVSELEFHPFSVAGVSVGGSGFWVHVQATGGADSFSRKLLAWPFGNVGGGGGGGAAEVHVQGPFGLPPRFTVDTGSEYSALVFVAGGIGITPIACIVSSLLQQQHEPKSNDCAEIVIVWTAKRCALFTRFAEWIARVHHQSSRRVRLALYCTGGGGLSDGNGDAELAPPGVTQGRPDLSRHIPWRQRAQQQEDDAAAPPPPTQQQRPVLVYACGPPALVAHARQLTDLANVPTHHRFYSETFE